MHTAIKALTVCVVSVCAVLLFAFSARGEEVAPMSLWACPPPASDGRMDYTQCKTGQINYTSVADCELHLNDWAANGPPFAAISRIHSDVTSGWTVQAECPAPKYKWVIP